MSNCHAASCADRAKHVKTLRDLVGAGDPEPTLTLQPVINQRRAKPSNEYRPEPRSQQAWSGGLADEARELRAFDRIREDTPFRPGAGKRKKRGKGQGQGQGPRGAGPGRSGNTSQPGARQGQRRGKGRGQAAAQTQIGVYQPPTRTWFAGEERPARGNRPPRGPRQGAEGTGNRDAGNRGNRDSGNRAGASRDGGNRPAGNRDSGNRFGGERAGGNRFGGERTGGNRPSGNRPSGNRPSGNRPGGDRGYPSQGQPRPFREEGLPRDDIGNRIGPGDRPGAGDRPAGARPKRRFKPRP